MNKLNAENERNELNLFLSNGLFSETELRHIFNKINELIENEIFIVADTTKNLTPFNVGMSDLLDIPIIIKEELKDLFKLKQIKVLN